MRPGERKGRNCVTHWQQKATWTDHEEGKSRDGTEKVEEETCDNKRHRRGIPELTLGFGRVPEKLERM